jgi:superfamily I DNA/RNA helicase
MTVSNYHGLGLRLLSGYGHLLGWPRETALLPPPANQTVIAEAIQDLGIRGLSEYDAADAISALKGQRSDATGSASLTLVGLRERYDELLAERFLRDFDDLILHSIRLLQAEPTIRQVLQDAYPFVFIDELQDTNKLQLDLLGELIGEETRVFAVADDDQMIYGWRDAHPGNIDEFVNRFNATESSLTGNYRCPPAIVAAANAVIVNNIRRSATLMQSRVGDRYGEVIVIEAATKSEGEVVASEIERAVTEGIPLGEIAVLAPHKFKFQMILDALDDHEIAWVNPGGDRLAQNVVVKLLRLSLRSVAGGVLTEVDVEPFNFSRPASELVATIRERAEQAADGPPRGLLNRLVGGFDLGTVREPVREADAIRVLARMVRKAIDDETPTTSADLASSMLLHWNRLEAAALRAEQAVKVMTSFNAKGTEYQLVILPFMNDGVVPYAPKGKSIDWSEGRRLFYVALTRAERRVVLTYDHGRSRSTFLTEIELHATDSWQA